METKNQKQKSQSITFKGIIIVVLSLLLLIPNLMIQSLITERQERSKETITKINSKWSNSQTILGPVLTIPYMAKTTDKDNKEIIERRLLNISPELLQANVKLNPEIRHYGIYKSILYRSDIHFSGNFSKATIDKMKDLNLNWENAYVSLGLSDLKGVTQKIDFKIDNSICNAEASEDSTETFKGKRLVFKPKAILNESNLNFSCNLSLNGSTELNFIPMGKITKVQIEGDWKSPGFVGMFSPQYSISGNGFKAEWNVMHFNRNIPEMWNNKTLESVDETAFGVNLVDTVDHYQQNMRSAKYALMFIALTFVVFFFVEVLTGKRIHPIQYLLVGIALVLFYSLLLSISEQMNFGLAYLLASVAIIGLISSYAYSVFKNKSQTAILSGVLILLYLFLYFILQLEDIALLVGSIGLFIILGIIMYLSRKINWYKKEELIEDNQVNEEN